MDGRPRQLLHSPSPSPSPSSSSSSSSSSPSVQLSSMAPRPPRASLAMANFEQKVEREEEEEEEAETAPLSPCSIHSTYTSSTGRPSFAVSSRATPPVHRHWNQWSAPSTPRSFGFAMSPVPDSVLTFAKDFYLSQTAAAGEPRKLGSGLGFPPNRAKKRTPLRQHPTPSKFKPGLPRSESRSPLHQHDSLANPLDMPYLYTVDIESRKTFEAGGTMDDEIRSWDYQDQSMEEEEEEEEDDEFAPPGSNAVRYLSLFRYAEFWDKFLMITGLVAALLNGSLTPWYSWLLGSFVTKIGTGESVREQLHDVNRICSYMIGLTVLAMITSYFEVTCWAVASERQAMRMRSKYLRAVLTQNAEFFDICMSTEDVLHTISSDIALIQDAIGDKVGSFLHHLATFIFGYLVGFLKSWKISLVILVVSPLMIICGKVHRAVYIDLASKEEGAYRQAGNLAQQAISSIRTVYSCVAEKCLYIRYSKLLENSLPFGIKLGFARGGGIGVIYLVSYATWALAIWFGSLQVSHKAIDGGDALACFFGAIIGGRSLGLALPYIANFTEGCMAAFRVFQLIDRIPPIDINSPTGIILENVDGSIEFVNVCFAYPARPESLILQDFSLLIKSKRRMALIGPSGSGKSTVICLLERFYDPMKGSISLDGIDIRKLQLRWLRKQIGLVGQEPVMFATTIMENILYGRENATKEEVMAASKAADAHTFISTLPDGYNTQVGEHGIQLSGGQKQRIAIARAILKNPRILLLDEATSALDSQSENIVQAALNQMARGRTTIIIAHNITTIKDADSIAVMENGKVVEQGSHNDLLAKNGLYCSLVSTFKASLEAGHRRTHHETPRYSPWQTPAYSSIEGETNLGPQLERSSQVGIPFLRIMSLNKTEIPILFFGLLNAIHAGIIFPLFSYVIGQAIRHYFDKDANEMKKDVNRSAIVLLALGLASLVAMTGQHGFCNWAGSKVTKKVREQVFKSLLRQEVGWFDRDENMSGSLLACLSMDSTYVRAVSSEWIPLLLMGLASIGVGLILCGILQPKMVWIAVLVTPFLISSSYIQFLMALSSKQDEAVYSKASSIAAEAVGNIRTVTVFSSEDRVGAFFDKSLLETFKRSFEYSQKAAISFGLSQSLMYGSYTLILWYGSILVKKDETDFGDVIKIFLVLVLSSFSIGNLARTAPDSSKVGAAVQSVFQIIDRVPIICPEETEADELTNVRGEIQLRKVVFAYPSRPDVQIFDGFSLVIKAGTAVALVGGSGSGKSTVISLIERFYDPIDGRVLLDKVDIRQLNLEWLRKQMALVSQEPILFSFSIRENIAYGKPNASNSEIEEAARVANAHGFISTLPEGYETQVGERGGQLSGGQKQRIAIARAVLRNPKILLLDEPTSALDMESERKVQEALDQIMLRRTTVVVAHRLSTIRNVNQIAVIQDGCLVELGTHQKLMENHQGAYFSLVQSQNTIH